MDQPVTDRLWPRPQEAVATGAVLRLAGPLRLRAVGAAAWLPVAAQAVADALNAAAGRIVARADGRAGPDLLVTDRAGLPPAARLRPVARAEGYALAVTGSGVVLAGSDAAGLRYGAGTLAQLFALGTGTHLAGMRIRDWPHVPMRGAHLFVPPRRHLDFCHRLIAYLADLKYNTLFLEIGGGMEFRRHPEINRAWRRFSRAALAYDWRQSDPFPASRKSDAHYGRPGVKWPLTGPVALQVSRYFWKDSAHPEVGGGAWLTQAELRELADACRRRGIEIIPEVQSLSHCYWLCCAHPEIAERTDDPWPDAYCPSNPRTYELLFDVMDEVIALFQPRVLHIGHDELLSLRVCPRCRRRSGAELFAADVRRIHEYLAARGIRTMLWADKLIKVGRFSGAGRTEKDPGNGRRWVLPPTHRAIDLIPRDAILCDWYWGLAPWAQAEFERRGFDVCFGNFAPLDFPDWSRRSRSPRVLGAEVSSWCEVSPYAFGHNRIMHDFFSGAGTLWHGRQLPRADVGRVMAWDLPGIADRLACGQRRWIAGGVPGRLQAVDIAAAARPLPAPLHRRIRCGGSLALPTGAGSLDVLAGRSGVLARAIVLGPGAATAPALTLPGRATRLVVLHGTTLIGLRYQPTYYMYDRGPAQVLACDVSYADGTVATFDASYGDEIGPIVGTWPQAAAAACFRAVPVPAGPRHTLYAQEWLNPRPRATLRCIVFRLGRDATATGHVLVAAIATVT